MLKYHSDIFISFSQFVNIHKLCGRHFPVNMQKWLGGTLQLRKVCAIWGKGTSMVYQILQRAHYPYPKSGTFSWVTGGIKTLPCVCSPSHSSPQAPAEHPAYAFTCILRVSCMDSGGHDRRSPLIWCTHHMSLKYMNWKKKQPIIKLQLLLKKNRAKKQSMLVSALHLIPRQCPWPCQRLEKWRIMEFSSRHGNWFKTIHQ